MLFLNTPGYRTTAQPYSGPYCFSLQVNGIDEMKAWFFIAHCNQLPVSKTSCPYYIYILSIWLTMIRGCMRFTVNVERAEREKKDATSQWMKAT